MSEKKQFVTSLRVDPDLWKEAKIQAIKNDMELNEVVDAALREWIKKKAKE
jgi:predicted HicB family RNase H-like nuclease